MAARGILLAVLIIAAAGCSRVDRTTTPPQAAPPPAVPATLGSPMLTLDVPPGVAVILGSTTVAFRDAPEGSSRFWLSPQLPLQFDWRRPLPDGRVRYAFAAPADEMNRLRNTPEVRAHPDLEIGYIFRLCAPGPLPTAGRLIVTARFAVPPMPPLGPDPFDVREAARQGAVVPCGRG